MRPSEVAKHWASLAKAPGRPLILKSFEYHGLPGIRDGVVAFDSPVTALCGLNGSGKSAVLEALWATLCWRDAQEHLEIIGRLGSATLKAELLIGNTEVACLLDLSQSPVYFACPDVVAASWLDVARLSPRLQEMFFDEELSSLLDAYEPIDLSDEEKKIISFLCRKDFDDFKIFEIDEFDGDVIPFMSASDHGDEYDIRTMSLGEIALSACYWTLRRAKPGTIVLLEEPETYTSPASQSALMDLIVYMSVRNKLTVIFTTHSVPMFSRLNRNQVRFIFRAQHGSRFASPDQFDQMRRLVGFKSPQNVAIFVEDRAAREFTKLLLSRFDMGAAEKSDIVDVAGFGNINAIRQVFPTKVKAVSVVGLYDADKRGEVEVAGENDWPVAFLPGDGVEHMFRQVASADPDTLAAKLGREPATLEPVLSGLMGLDDHDWFEELGKATGVAYEQLMMACFEAWIATEANRAAAQEFVESFPVLRA